MKPLCCALCLILFSICSAAAAPLKIGVLLIEDSVPLYLAEQEHLYAKENIEVELVPFLSALERDSALTAGAIDGAVSDPVGAILFDQGRGIIQITSLCLGAAPAEGVFAILAAPKSSLQTIEDLKHVDIGISNATIIEYVTDRLLEANGFAPEEIKTIEVKKMPIRMQMLLANTIQAATLPEPLASIAVAKGARILLSDADNSTSLSQTVMIFRKDVLRKRPADVKALFRALTEGISAINSDPEKYRPLFVEKSRIPPYLAKDYPIPHYPLPAPFPPELYEPIVSWLTAKHLTPQLAYETMVATDVFTK
jgi:NitT/TauT family transport system substrate-binding protein